MARLPDIQSARPVARPSRAIASISPNAAAATGQAVQGIGQEVEAFGKVMFDRETTAEATERDTMLSNQIRDLIYNPETGFAGMKGNQAVQSRQSTIEKLESLKENAYKGLNADARRKLESSLTRRITGAMDTVERHTLGERDNWLAGASAARVEAAYQDSLFNPADTAASLTVIENETRARGVREGWGSERTQVELEANRSKLFADQVTRIAASDPIAAMEYMRNNQDRMVASDITNLETRLQPEIKKAVGRQMGVEAFVGTGNLGAAFEVASDTIGMNENAQREALQAYLKDGGVNLDPAKTAWCAAFINASLAKAGMSGTASNMARSFLNWGDEVSEPKKGDVVVLSRGEPPFGHVGFFDGYDEDGSIRLLGGNQSNNVSIASYDAGRVLGIRRMANPDESGAAKGLSALVNIADPLERAAAIDEYNMRVSITEGQRKASLASAQDAAFQMIESGGSLDALPVEVRQSLGQTAMTSLRSYQSTIARGDTVRTNDARYYELRQMQANDPQRFRQLNLMEDRHLLDDTDWQKMVDAQTKPASDITTSAASTLMTMASRQLVAAGFDTTPEEGNDDANAIASLQSRLLHWQDDFAARENRAPTKPEIDERVGRELMSVLIDRPWRADSEAAMIKQMGKEFSAEDLEASEITIGGTTIPNDQVRTAISILRNNGTEVTPETLLDFLAESLTELGF